MQHRIASHQSCHPCHAYYTCSDNMLFSVLQCASQQLPYHPPTTTCTGTTKLVSAVAARPVLIVTNRHGWAELGLGVDVMQQYASAQGGWRQQDLTVVATKDGERRTLHAYSFFAAYYAPWHHPQSVVPQLHCSVKTILRLPLARLRRCRGAPQHSNAIHTNLHTCAAPSPQPTWVAQYTGMTSRQVS